MTECWTHPIVAFDLKKTRGKTSLIQPARGTCMILTSTVYIV